MMVKKMTTLDYIKKSRCADFGHAFAIVAGRISMDAECEPNASYSVTDVQELMDYLLKLQAVTGKKMDLGSCNCIEAHENN